MFQKYVADIQDALPLAPEDRPSKRGLETPMEVMDAPYRAGDLRHGYQAVADNLPNDPRVHEQKGSKKIFFKNFMDARVELRDPAAGAVRDAARAGGQGLGRRLSAGHHHARDRARAGSGVSRTECRQGDDSRSHRPGLSRAGRSQGRCGGHVRPEVAGGSRCAAQRQAGRILRVVCGRTFSAPCVLAPAKRTARRR